MSRTTCRSCVVLLFCALGAHAQSAPTSGPAREFSLQARLPVTRVVLYKNGVGYFEHSTQVRGTRELNIDFTTAQLNDVLSSLTVVDLGQGHITNVHFNSMRRRPCKSSARRRAISWTAS